ncbi:M23 family metallopeptidase, partial [Leptospira santarosai]|uniref:M23 family metallopeptidase n=1 Tax=Leptospira santarosai TaxID=28183 RepID=UPI0026E2DADF
AEERARAAQNRNNSEQGASNISAAGTLTQRRDEDGLPAHGVPGLNDPSQTLASSGSFGPDGESTGVGGRPLSSEDKAAFWENWRGETRAQTDASLADLRRMGYDTSDLEGRVQAYRNNQDSRPGSATSTPQPTTHQSQGTGLYGGVVQNILNSAMSGASSLWDRITGGSSKPSGAIAGSDGNFYRISDGKGSNEKVLEILDRNGKPILDQNGKPVKGFSVWSGEGPLKQFDIISSGSKPTFTSSDGYQMSQPLDGKHIVTDTVHGNKNSPDYPQTDFHRNEPYHQAGHLGTDLIPQNPSKVNLYAAEGGSIVSIDRNTNGIKIKADSGYTLNYLHSSGLSEGIYPGARVEAGQAIGRIGGASNSKPNGYGVHLHFQVRDQDGKLLSTQKVFDRYEIE